MVQSWYAKFLYDSDFETAFPELTALQAIPKLLEKYRLSLSDIDVIEINEAFASMAVYCRDKLDLDWSKMNPRGERT